MDYSEWRIRFVLSKCRSQIFDLIPDVNNQSRFESEDSESLNGFQSDIITGRVVCSDKKGNQMYSKPLILKAFPEAFTRSTFTEVTFQNEIFMYNKFIPFFGTLDDSILTLFPKFYHSQLNFDDKEDGIMVLENLSLEGYRSMTSKVFIDIDHLVLSMKKLAKFHAFSYQAKKQDPEKFFSMVDCLKESHRSVIKKLPKSTHTLSEYFFDILSHDLKYAKKIEQIRQLIGEADAFVTKVFDTKEEPVAVLCHGDFLRNNILCKYDPEMNPTDLKFIDLGDARYCTPVVDLGLILYMNADQPTRDEYWDLLIDTYYDSLKNTFRDNDLVPSKSEILAEFKYNIVQPFLMVAPFIPWMMTVEESNSPDWFKDLCDPDYTEYKDSLITSIPGGIRNQIFMRMFKPHRVEKVLDALRDIIDRGFV